MADLNQLQQKYQPVIDTIQQFAEFGAKVDGVGLDGDKLILKGEVPSKVVANRVWDVIKECDPTYSDLEHQIATTGGDDQEYHLKSGDTLSKISKLFYGDPNKYQAIADASGMDNPNKGLVGQKIIIPPLS